MTLAIYADLDGRHYWAEPTSPLTLRHLARGEWTLFDATPDTPPPPGDPFDAKMTAVAQDSSSDFYAQQRAAYATRGVATRSVARTRPPSAVKLSAGGTFSGASASSVVADTSDFSLGTSAAKLGTDGAGGYATFSFPSVAWDMSAAAALRLTLKIDSYDNMNFLLCDVGTGGGFSNRYEVAVGEMALRTTLRVAREGEWLVLDYPRDLFAVNAGAPDWSIVTNIRVAATDKNGTPLTVHINGVGVVPASPLLPAGAAIFTFDDSYVSHWTIAKPALDAVGAPGVAFPIADQVGGSGLSMTQLRLMHDVSGWEIGTHAMTVADHAAGMIGLTQDQVRTKFDALKDWSRANGFASDAHAWPSGDSDAVSEMVAREYVSSARGTTAGTQSSAYPNPMRMRCHNMAGMNLATAQAKIDAAKSGKNVAVFLCHDIKPSNPTGLDSLQSVVEGAITYAAAQGVPIMTMTQVLRQMQLL